MIISVVIRVVEGAQELLVGPLCSVAITLNQAVYSAPLHLPQAQDFLLVLPRNQRPGSAPVDSEEEHQHHHFLGHRRQLHQVRFSVLQLQAAMLAVFLAHLQRQPQLGVSVSVALHLLHQLKTKQGFLGQHLPRVVDFLGIHQRQARVYLELQRQLLLLVEDFLEGNLQLQVEVCSVVLPLLHQALVLVTQLLRHLPRPVFLELLLQRVVSLEIQQLHLLQQVCLELQHLPLQLEVDYLVRSLQLLPGGCLELLHLTRDYSLPRLLQLPQ
mmetsp:Transcript_993/g.1298  ORF Transcript_993/g.1298 Transcript_993/m.1298 type:complete len:270 (-) Transcript_993:4844-5653(-)